MKKADMIIDLQYGSTGKGLIAGFLAEMNGYDTVVNANMPNAGHTYINKDRRKWIHKVLPNGIVSPNLRRVMIGPGSIFSISRLADELEQSEDILSNAIVYIHKDAVIVDNSHVEHEKGSLNGIASTMQGSSAAMIEKIQRNPYKDPRVNQFSSFAMRYGVVVVDQQRWLELLYESDNILIEGAQGYSLGINAGFWPYCTSRDCTPARFLADCGIPHKMLKRVIGTARVHPIRVGNTEGGWSGPYYNDQKEIQWGDIGQEPETTTVTGRIRRIFNFSRLQIREAIMACNPDLVFLNFCNYAPDTYNNTVDTIQDELDKFVPGSVVRFLGFGPSSTEISISYRGAKQSERL